MRLWKQVERLAVSLVLATSASLCFGVDQFVSNGTSIDGWDEHPNDAANNGPLQQSYHFSKKFPTDEFWQQKLVRRYRNDPDNVYFYDPVTRVWIGRYELNNGQYSRLEFKDRRHNFMNIPKSAFPPASDNPSLYQLSRNPCEAKVAVPGSPPLMDLTVPDFKEPTKAKTSARNGRSRTAARPATSSNRKSSSSP